MQINLNDELVDHFERVKRLAEEAETTEDESISSRAAGMSTLSRLIRDLVTSQESVINMDRLQRIEQVTVETIKEFLTEDQYDAFIQRLREALHSEDYSESAP